MKLLVLAFVSIPLAMDLQDPDARAAEDLVERMERWLRPEPGVFEELCRLAADGRMVFGGTPVDWAPAGSSGVG